MNVFIARDGAILGEYPQAEVEEMARRGELDTYDDYWQEGMEAWRPLPHLLAEGWESPSPPAPPLDFRSVAGGAIGALLLVAVLAFLFLRSDREGLPLANTAASTPDAARQLEIRDKAAADLRRRIERLPGSATPPLNTFYYDVRVNMSKMLDVRTPWSATMRGFENVVDPATQETLRRTEFTLTANYRDGEWVYKHYRASTLNVGTGMNSEIVEDEHSATPPIITGMLGLQRPGR